MMKNIAVLFVVLIQAFKLDGQNSFAEAISFYTKVTGDFVYNHSGGIKKGYTYMGMEDFSVEFNTASARWWKGGSFFIHGLNMHGQGISENFTGDLQVLSNIEAGDYTGLYEYYYQQNLGKYSFLIGQHDLNSEFVGTKYGGTFINSSFGIAPAISLNMPVSIYPVAAPCLLLKYITDKDVIYKIAVYDGDPGDFESNRFNLHWNINKDQGYFSIGEIEYNRIKTEWIRSTYKIGSFYHSGEFRSFEDTTLYSRGNYGIYGIIDQPLFAGSLSWWRGLCFFVQVCLVPQRYNMISDYIGTGFRFHGILPNRVYDELGIAFARIGTGRSYSKIYPASRSYETAIETTYRFSFGRRYSIQPSFQYLINPGLNPNNRNSFVSLIRFPWNTEKLAFDNIFF